MKEAIQGSQGSPETAEGYWEARRAPASVVAKAKTQLWVEFGEAMVKDFWLASRKFWQIVRVQEGKAGFSSGCAQSGREKC